MTTRKLQTLQGGKSVPIESENEQIDFASVRIGADKATLSRVAADTLQLNVKLRAIDGTNALDFATKGQVDTAATTASGATASEASTRAAADTVLSTALTAEAVARAAADATEVSARTTADAGLQTQVTANAAAIVTEATARDTAVTTEASTRVSADLALDGRVTTNTTNITSLSGSLAAILANNPAQYRTVVVATSQTIFDTASFTFDPLATVLDIELFVNGAKWVQCTVGDFSTGGFRKNSAHVVEVSQAIPKNAEVVLWKQGTSSAGSGGSGANLDAITTNPAPTAAGGQTLGTLAKPWAGVYIKDAVSGQVYLLQVVNKIFDVTEVP